MRPHHWSSLRWPETTRACSRRSIAPRSVIGKTCATALAPGWRPRGHPPPPVARTTDSWHAKAVMCRIAPLSTRCSVQSQHGLEPMTPSVHLRIPPLHRHRQQQLHASFVAAMSAMPGLAMALPRLSAQSGGADMCVAIADLCIADLYTSQTSTVQPLSYGSPRKGEDIYVYRLHGC